VSIKLYSQELINSTYLRLLVSLTPWNGDVYGKKANIKPYCRGLSLLTGGSLGGIGDTVTIGSHSGVVLLAQSATLMALH